MAEIKTLLDGYARKKKRLAKACTSNLQTQQKKCTKEELELHKGRESLQQGQENKAREQESQQNNSQLKDQKEGSQTRENEHPPPKDRPQEMQQQHLNRPRPCTPKLLTPVVPMVLDVAQIGHSGHPWYSMPGVRGAEMQQQHLNRPRPCTPKLLTPVVPMVLNVAQIGHSGHPRYSMPGVRGAPVFALPPGAAQYIGPFNPFYPNPQFFPKLAVSSLGCSITESNKD